MKLHTAVPLEGVGVVHITTKPIDCPAGFWDCYVALWRYVDGVVHERVPLTDSLTEAGAAHEMHTYFCDIETLVLCVQGDRKGLIPCGDLEYFDRKQRELFGREC